MAGRLRAGGRCRSAVVGQGDRCAAVDEHQLVMGRAVGVVRPAGRRSVVHEADRRVELGLAETHERPALGHGLGVEGRGRTATPARRRRRSARAPPRSDRVATRQGRPRRSPSPRPAPRAPPRRSRRGGGTLPSPRRHSRRAGRSRPRRCRRWCPRRRVRRSWRRHPPSCRCGRSRRSPIHRLRRRRRRRWPRGPPGMRRRSPDPPAAPAAGRRVGCESRPTRVSGGATRTASSVRCTSPARPASPLTVVDADAVRPSRWARTRTVVTSSATFWWITDVANRVSASR